MASRCRAPWAYFLKGLPAVPELDHLREENLVASRQSGATAQAGAPGAYAGSRAPSANPFIGAAVTETPPRPRSAARVAAQAYRILGGR